MRSLVSGTSDWLTTSTPPGLTAGSKRSIDGMLSTTAEVGWAVRGEPISTSDTMIVHRADMFGLAQLYQIRGRVGRSKTRAYAYLTTKPRGRLTATAEKRLRVLSSLDTLGAGFTLASQDLDISGAGNLLGDVTLDIEKVPGLPERVNAPVCGVSRRHPERRAQDPRQRGRGR